jgi:hypothetical protein
MIIDGTPPERRDDGPVTLTTLASDFGDVLAVYSNRSLVKINEANSERVDALREQLFHRVFDYDSAAEMAKWGEAVDDATPSILNKVARERLPQENRSQFEDPNPGQTLLGFDPQQENAAADEDPPGLGMEEWARLSPEERSRLEKADPWRAFAEYEHEHGSLWIYLLTESWELWHRVQRPEATNTSGNSVFDVLIAKLDLKERNRFPGEVPEPSLKDRFLKARQSAWKVVVQEMLKPLQGSYKLPNLQPDHADLQKRFLARTPGQRAPFYEVPQWLQKIEETKVKVIDPTKELVAALLWTSAELPLCLMKSSAAADAVHEILWSGIRRNPEEITDPEAFLKSFRVMTGERSLVYFEEILKGDSGRAEIITKFVVNKVRSPADAAPGPGEDGQPRNGGEPGSNPDAPSQGLDDFLKRVDHLKKAVEEASSALSKAISDQCQMREEAAATGVETRFGPELEERLREVGEIHGSLHKQSFRLLRLRQELRKEILSPELPETPVDSKKFATLEVDLPYSAGVIKTFRFRFLDLHTGLIARDDGA